LDIAPSYDRSFLFLSLFLVVTAFAETPAQFDALKAQVTALQTHVNALQQNNALLLAPFVTVIRTRKIMFPARTSPFRVRTFISILGGIDDSPKWMVMPQYYP
jgi:hypothetical protein